MGLIKAAIDAAGGVLADQWLEYIYCDAIPADTLVVKGKKRTDGRSSNTKGSENVISNGSSIAVADGQCMIIVDNGKVLEVCAEPGVFTFDSSTEPSLFVGDLAENIGEVFKNIGARFTYGGMAGKDQRVYYFNIKEIVGNKYGTPQPVPFRVVDTNVGLDMDISITCFGEYSYRICDPILFYTNVCGNLTGTYTRDQIESQLKTELLTALQPAFAKISAMGIRYSALPNATTEIADALNEVLSAKWRDLRGIEVVSFGVSSVKAPEEDEKMIKELQRNAALRDPNMRMAHIAGATAAAMQTAAGNENGAMAGLMGMGMVGGMGQVASGAMFQQAPATQQQYANNYGTAADGGFNSFQQAPAAAGWTCSCGAQVTGNFCPNCGSPKPAPVEGWTCSCGAVNQGKFCSNCGAPKPAGVPQYKCDKCGWTPEDPANPPKFCPQCGDPFGDEDIQ